MARQPTPPLSLGEHVCLALVAQGATHGWQVGTLLAPAAEIGRVWTMSRPLTYRALELLTDKRLLRRRSTVGARRERQLLAVTAAGRRVHQAWLEEPVEHLRDVRTELLLKLVLRERAGLDVAPLLERQREAFAERIEALTEGSSAPDLVALWRRESARAVRRFLDAATAGARDAAPASAPRVRISARNQLRATVTSVVHGEVMSTVKARLGDGQVVTAAITKESVGALDLAEGDEVVVIVKATEVMLAKL